MPRANAMVPPEAIRIEDEVWQEAFARREPARPNRRRRLEAVDGGRSDWLPDHAWAAPDEEEAEAHAMAPAGPVAVSEAPLAVLPTVRSPEAAPVRRTIKIQGRGAERNLPLPDASRRRPSRRPHERAGFRPDRLAMWAVVLGFLLVLVAVSSGHG